MRTQWNGRLSPAAHRVVRELARRWGVSQAAVLEVLLRERAERDGLAWSQDAEAPDDGS